MRVCSFFISIFCLSFTRFSLIISYCNGLQGAFGCLCQAIKYEADDSEGQDGDDETDDSVHDGVLCSGDFSRITGGSGVSNTTKDEHDDSQEADDKEHNIYNPLGDYDCVFWLLAWVNSSCVDAVTHGAVAAPAALVG